MRQEYASMTEQHLGQVADMLLLNGTLTECPGLVHGKMGIAIFFFHYARYTGNELFADYAMDLIGEMLNQIHVYSPVDYEKGLAGIGVGIDYLIRNNFLNAEDEIFEDFDQRMYRAVMYDPWLNFSQYDGLTGYGKYWLSRLCQEATSVQARKCLFCITERIEERFPDIPLNEQTDVYCFLHDLHKISGFDICIGLIEQCQKWGSQSAIFLRFGDSIAGNIIRMYRHSYYFNDAMQCEIDIAMKQIPDLDMEKPPVSMGLLTGYAGEGMLRLTALRQTDHLWTFLL